MESRGGRRCGGSREGPRVGPRSRRGRRRRRRGEGGGGGGGGSLS